MDNLPRKLESLSALSVALDAGIVCLVDDTGEGVRYANLTRAPALLQGLAGVSADGLSPVDEHTSPASAIHAYDLVRGDVVALEATLFHGLAVAVARVGERPEEVMPRKLGDADATVVSVDGGHPARLLIDTGHAERPYLYLIEHGDMVRTVQVDAEGRDGAGIRQVRVVQTTPDKVVGHGLLYLCEQAAPIFVAEDVAAGLGRVEGEIKAVCLPVSHVVCFGGERSIIVDETLGGGA
ncbi:hypothetical protein J2T57_001647 [Natronocella acetinitrilica]|uniref:Uncharacterized protein n=1 Tax=Natronocella acetinitrilica TaxID=414046 RepID=A0AAE3G2C8_9GAMM|nr:hypothetical protein [Natronocella acetinitrilica]MCP1674545.1 hypothetical protein [Natronocella acetinitrilica]